MYRVLRELDAAGSLEGAIPARPSRLVGREQEIGLLLERWAQVKEGFGQVVLVSGEAGIGKSRLVQGLTASAAGERYLRVESRCSPYHQHSALYPVTELLRRAFAIARDQTPDARLEHALHASGLLACGQAGRLAQGLTLLDEALALVGQNGERHHEAEIHRVRGELLLKLPARDTRKAERCFLTALEIARRQQAKSLELPAATSLGRLWQGQGKRDEACRLLAEIYGWFTEGFDTADLHDAGTLLDALS